MQTQALTERETQVLELLLKGLTNDAIARKLSPSIKPKGVKFHLTKIYTKFQVRTRSELFALFLAKANRPGKGLS